MLTLNHKNLDTWKQSMNLVTEVYKLTKNYPKEELFGLASQMRRASVSISSNISEGSSRDSAVERRRFYEISRSSLVELDTQMEISLRLKYINQKESENISKLTNHLFALLTKLKKSTK